MILLVSKDDEVIYSFQNEQQLQEFFERTAGLNRTLDCKIVRLED